VLNKETNTVLPFPEWFQTHFLPAPNGSNPKHTDDYWFLQSTFRHPLRVYDPDKAKFFVVPILLNQLMYNMEEFCYLDKCWEDLVKMADETLGRSEYFHRFNGADHILVASHSSPKERLPKGYRPKSKSWTKYYPHLTNCNILVYYDLPGSRFNSKKRLYVSEPCTPVTGKTHELSMIASMDITKAAHQDRHNICLWIQEEQPNSSAATNITTNDTDPTRAPFLHNYSKAVCGRGSQCPNLAQAKYGFHVRGDKLGSNRLADTLLSGTVPISRGQNNIV
jgi:hypothetical protein